MYQENQNFKFYFHLILIILIKSNLITSSIIVNRDKLNLSDNQNLIASHNSSKSSFNSSFESTNSTIKSTNQSIDTQSLNNLNQSSISLNLVNQTSIKLNESKLIQNLNLTNQINFNNKNLDFVADQNQLIHNLVKEEDHINRYGIRNEINLDELNETLSTNNILPEGRMINEFKKMNQSNEFKNLDIKNDFNLIKNESIDKSIDKSLVNQPSNDTLDFINNFNLTLIEKVNPILHTIWEKENVFELDIIDSFDCMFVRSEEGVYSFKSNRSHNELVCALYMIADPNRLIEFQFIQFNMNCEKSDDLHSKNGSLVSIIDGWEMRGEFFPSLEDHQLNKSERYKEICVNETNNENEILKQTYRVSQNVGLVQFRVSNKNEGFKIRVKFVENPRPCNVIFPMPTGIHTLKNYGQAINCSVSLLFPEKITIISNSIGTKSLISEPLIEEKETSLDKKPSNYYDYQLNRNQSQIDFMDESNDEKVDNNTIQSNADDCFNNIENDIIHDYIEIKGGNGLDTDQMMMANKMCFVKELKRKKVEIDCENTAIRLVSSGMYDNSITVAFDLLETPQSNSFRCPQRSSFKG